MEPIHPLAKIWVFIRIDSFPNFRDENLKKYLKPPPSQYAKVSWFTKIFQKRLCCFFLKTPILSGHFLLSRFYGKKNHGVFCGFSLMFFFWCLKKLGPPFFGTLTSPKKVTWRWVGWEHDIVGDRLTGGLFFVSTQGKQQNKQRVLLTRWAPSRSLFFWSYGAPKSMAKNKWANLVFNFHPTCAGYNSLYNW